MFEQQRRLALLDLVGGSPPLVLESRDDHQFEVDVMFQPIDIERDTLLQVFGIGLSDHQQFNVHDQ